MVQPDLFRGAVDPWLHNRCAMCAGRKKLRADIGGSHEFSLPGQIVADIGVEAEADGIAIVILLLDD